MIVGWHLATNMQTTFVLNALKMALGLSGAGADVQPVRSDRASQYVNFDYTQAPTDYRVQSVGSVGDAFDKALVS